MCVFIALTDAAHRRESKTARADAGALLVPLSLANGSSGLAVL